MEGSPQPSGVPGCAVCWHASGSPWMCLRLCDPGIYCSWPFSVAHTPPLDYHTLMYAVATSTPGAPSKTRGMASIEPCAWSGPGEREGILGEGAGSRMALSRA